MSIAVYISTVADGSMLNRHDAKDQAVIQNRQIFLEKHGLTMDQATRLDTQLLRRATIDHETDYCKFFTVGKEAMGAGMRDDDVVTADAIVTTELGHILILPVADCVGAVLYVESKQVLMMSHLGRHSLEQHGAQKSVEYLISHHTVSPAEIKVWLTPAAGKEKFPIWALNNQSMKEATLEQLLSAGVLESNIIDSPIHTDEDETYYSYSEFLKGHRNEDGDHMIVAVMQ